MPKTKISEFSATPANNTDIDSINIAEGCAPSGINDAIRELMAQLKDFQTGAVGDSFNGPIGTTTAAAGAFTTLSSTGNTTLGDASGDAITVNGTATFANANPTLTAGTANGVTYLNGSKVLTSGSALTYSATSGLTTNGVTQGYNTTLYTVDGTLSNYSAANNVYLNGNTAGGLNLRGDGTGGASTQLFLGGATSSEASKIIFTVANSEGMRLTSTGLGIGTSSPAYKLNIVEAKTLTPTTGDGQITIDNSTSGQVSAILFSSQATRRAQISAGLGGSGNDGFLAFTTRNDSTGFGERARIDSSGNLLVGTTSTVLANSFVQIQYSSTSQYGMAIKNTSSTYNGSFINFLNSSGTSAGSIVQNGTTTVSYSTSSDYRLKNTIAPMTGALAKVALLKPVTYKWNSDGSDGQGFIAHELAEVCPEAVVGEKDAVDADGNPKYQGIDTSFLVATLTAAIQEQQALITTLTERITALEGV